MKPKIELGWNGAWQALEGHSGSVLSVAFLHDSKLLVSASEDETVRIWHTATGTPQQTVKIN